LRHPGPGRVFPREEGHCHVYSIMKIADILTPQRIQLRPSVTSQKRALELLSETLARDTPPKITDAVIFDALTRRERLGSTALGHGVAIPHGRIPGLDRAIGAVLKLQEGIDYDAPDQAPVDLLFALLVPEDTTEEHLALLAQLAEIFSDESRLAQLRARNTPEELMELFTHAPSSYAA